jgi:acyl carrier protein
VYMDPRDVALSVIAYTLKVPAESLQDGTLLSDVARDSIALFELLINFEKIIGTAIRYEDVVAIETVGDVVAYVSTLPSDSTNSKHYPIYC